MSFKTICLEVATKRSFIANKVYVCVLGRVRLFATPWTVACQASLSMGFSRQEYWSGFPFPSTGDLPDPGVKPRSPALQADSLPLKREGRRLGECFCSEKKKPERKNKLNSVEGPCRNQNNHGQNRKQWEERVSLFQPWHRHS